MRTRQKRYIETLDPARLKPSDFMDLSGTVRPCVTPILDHERLHHRELIYNSVSLSTRYTYLPFPEGTKGFLYHHEISETKMSHLIRFRLVPDGDPGKFAEGTDLQCPDGSPWCFLLPKGACSSGSGSNAIQKLLPDPDGKYLMFSGIWFVFLMYHMSFSKAREG